MNWGQFNAAGAAFVAGQQINQKLELGAEEIAQAKQQTAAMQMSNMAKQQQQQNQQQMAQWLKANFDSKQALAAAPEEQAKLFGQAANEALKRGDFTGAEKMQELAKGKMEDAKQVRLEQVAQQAQGQEELAKLALEAEASPTQENAMALVQKAVQQGEDPSKIPPPNSPAFSAWVKNKETGSMTAKDRLAALEKKREFDDQEKDRREKAKRDQETELERLRERAEDRRMSRQMQQEGLELRKMMVQSTLDARAEKKEMLASGQTPLDQRNARATLKFASQALRGIDLASEMAFGVPQGQFAELSKPDDILKAYRNVGANRLTSAEQQLLQTTYKGIGADMAMSVYVGASRGATESAKQTFIDMIAPKEGDKPITQAYRMANAVDVLRQEYKTNLDIKDPKVAEEQKAFVERMKAFPTPHQVLEDAKKHGEDLTQAVKEGRSARSVLEGIKRREGGEEGKPTAPNRPAEINDIMKKLGY